jgi:hypothetical protein
MALYQYDIPSTQCPVYLQEVPVEKRRSALSTLLGVLLGLLVLWLLVAAWRNARKNTTTISSNGNGSKTITTTPSASPMLTDSGNAAYGTSGMMAMQSGQPTSTGSITAQYPGARCFTVTPCAPGQQPGSVRLETPASNQWTQMLSKALGFNTATATAPTTTTPTKTAVGMNSCFSDDYHGPEFIDDRGLVLPWDQ